MTKSTTENSKGKFKEPKVEFSEYEIGKSKATRAAVIFESPKKTLMVCFYGDLEFKGTTMGEKDYRPVMCAAIYEKDNNKDFDFKEEPIASDKCRYIGDPVGVGCAWGSYNYMATSFSRQLGPMGMKDPFLRYLRKANFDGNSDNLNEFISFAQEQAIKKFPEYDKQRCLAEKKAEEEAEIKAANENKNLGQRLFDEYLPGLAEEKRAEIEEKVKNSRIGKIRKKIDDKYGTHLVERKVERKVKRQVAKAARREIIYE